MAVKCTICGGAHPSWDCSKPKKSTAVRLGRTGSNKAEEGMTQLPPLAGTQALPVDTPHKPKIGRPKTDFDRTEYQRLYMRDKATIKRLGLNCTVKEWREKNG